MFAVTYDSTDGSILSYTSMCINDFDLYTRTVLYNNDASDSIRTIYLDNTVFIGKDDVMDFYKNGLDYTITDTGELIKPSVDDRDDDW